MPYTPPALDAINFELAIYTPPALDAINFELAEIPPANLAVVVGLTIRKKLGKSDALDPYDLRGIYQMRMTAHGKRPFKMKFYEPTNPQTEPQQANRQKFADAVASWQALTPEQKNVYVERAKKLNMSGYNLFISEYLRSN